MHTNNYPTGTVRALLQTDLVLPQTKAVLQKRLEKLPVTEPSFFPVPLSEIVKMVCDRLIPQAGHERIDLAGALDRELADNRGNGWRYDTMPPDKESFTAGITGMNETAQELFKQEFIQLAPQQQDEVLHAIQNRNVSGTIWQSLPPQLFFEELLSRLVEIYYSHPLVKESIGDVSFADAHGWQHIQLNEREMHEPSPVTEADV